MGYINVSVDVQDVLDDLDDDDLIEECEHRGLPISSLRSGTGQAPTLFAAEVLDELYAGRIQDAICMLERSLDASCDPRAKMSDVRLGKHPFLSLPQ